LLPLTAAGFDSRRDEDTGTADGFTEIARGINGKIRLIETHSPPETRTAALASVQPREGAWRPWPVGSDR
jgi:hypothetical protein